MKYLLVILMLLPAAWCAGDDNPWAAWSYRLKLRVAQPEIADDTGLARVRVNLGPDAAKDLADVRIVDDKLREQPWRLVATTAAGETDIVFFAVKGCRDYTLIYGNAAAAKPRYGVTWPLGRVLIDDALPAKAYIHGLWSWVRTPVLSGAYSHANAVTDRFNYHGTSEFSGVRLDEDSEINQYVWLDAEKPPAQIVLRLVFEGRQNANSWDEKTHVNLYWGARNIKDLPGRSIKMGELPPAGAWHRLHVSVGELLTRASIRWRDGQVPDLFGIEFCADTGRAYWDFTTLGDVPAETDVVGLERAANAKPTFVWQKLTSFKIAGTDSVLTELRLRASAPAKAMCVWAFGDGSDTPTPGGFETTHVFVGQEPRTVSVTAAPTAAGVVVVESASREVDLKGAAPEQSFGLELVSCPFIARADDKALFNLRVEASLPQELAIEGRAVLLDAAGKELRVERADIMLMPGDKHPAFKSWSLDASAPGLARVRFEARFGGQTIATREVAFRSSRDALDGLTLAGDRFVDASGAPVVVLAQAAGDAPGGSPRAGAPAKTLVLGRAPIPDFETRLRKALGSEVVFSAVEPRPAWSLPARLVLAVASDKAAADADVVVVASAWEMMLAGVPARVAAESLGACVDQLRRSSKAEVLLVAPVAYAGCEDLARQYAVALRLLGIEKNVAVVDLYSRSVALADPDALGPEILKAARVESGVLIRSLHPRLADMAVETLADALLHPMPTVRSSK